MYSIQVVSAQDSTQWYIGKPISDFSFINLDRVPITDLKPIVKDYIGKDFTMDIFYEIQDKLYALEKFESITAEATEGDPERKSVVIKFTVKEKPIIGSIQTEGNLSVAKSDILEKASIKKGSFVNEAQIKVDEEAIRELYIDKGFNEVKVSSRTETDAANGTITVFFVIDEGSKTSIREIKFSGNSFASESTLRGELKSKQQDLFNPGVFQESKLIEDRAAIERYYRKNGFIKAKVDNIDRATELSEDKTRLYLTLTFYVTEGDQYTFGDVTFEGNVIFTTEKLKSLIRQQQGKFFDKVQWDTDFQAIQSLYYDGGYITNRFIPQEILDDVNKQVSYKIQIMESDRAHIENIIINGNVKTKTSVILRELPFEVGDIFSTDLIRKGIYSLYNLQYFSNIDAQPVQGSAPGLMDLVITVEEQSIADFKLGLAFSGNEFPVSGQIGWTDKNFLGSGVTLGADVEASLLKQGAAVNYQDNYLFGKNFGGGLSLSFYHNLFRNAPQDIAAPIFTEENVPDPFTSKTDYEEAIKNGTASSKYTLMQYDENDLQLAGNLSYTIPTQLGRIGITPELSTKASFVWYDTLASRHYNKAVRDNVGRWSFVNTVGLTLSLDNRDIFYNPENGYLFTQYFGYTGGLLLGDREFLKVKSRIEGFYTLFKIPVIEGFDFQTVLALHSALSFVLPQYSFQSGTSEIIATETEKLYIDGMNTGRGWSPQWDGEAMLEFAAELRHPLLKQMIWFTWFFDAVALLTDYNAFQTLDGEDFLMSFGFGLRLTIPGLPIRLYFVQPFKVRDGQIEWQTGGIPIGGPLNLKFVVAVTPPGGF